MENRKKGRKNMEIIFYMNCHLKDGGVEIIHSLRPNNERRNVDVNYLCDAFYTGWPKK